MGKFLLMCMPVEEDVAATDRLLRPAFGMYRIEWPDNPGVESNVGRWSKG